MIKSNVLLLPIKKFVDKGLGKFGWDGYEDEREWICAKFSLAFPVLRTLR